MPHWNVATRRKPTKSTQRLAKGALLAYGTAHMATGKPIPTREYAAPECRPNRPLPMLRSTADAVPEIRYGICSNTAEALAIAMNPNQLARFQSTEMPLKTKVFRDI